MSASRTAAIALLPVLLAASAMPFAAPAMASALPEAAAPSEAQISVAAPGEAELHRRTAAQGELGPALRAASKDASSAGAYFDESDLAVFLTTGDPARARGKLLKLIPGEARVRFQRVKHSSKDLEAVQAQINADLRAGRLGPFAIESTAIDTRGNRVVVGASRVDDALRETLADAYGDRVVVAFEGPSEGGDGGTCLSRQECPPAKGGLRIDKTNGAYCTSGPMVRVLGSNTLRILTAGHCLALSGGAGTSKTWTHNGAGIGWSEFHTWADGADADVGLINPSSYPVSGARNLLYRSSSSDVVGITSWKPTAEQIQGSLVCRSGAVSGHVCGQIKLTNRTKSVDGGTIDHQWVVDFDACPGDSGATYLAGIVAWGIHSDSTSGCNPDTNEAWYSPMGWVFDTLAQQGHPVELCTNPTCSAGANAWTTRGSLDEVAWNPRLVTLPDGRVLRVGGDDGDLVPGATIVSPAPSVELFDPVTNAWSDTAPPPWLPLHCAGQFAAAMADGTVLVGGGASMEDTEGDPCGTTAYRFDPSSGPTGSWTATEPLPAAIVSAGSVLLDDGRLLVTGGAGSNGATSLVLAYSPTDDEWTTLTPAPTGAYAPLVLRLGDGRVLVSGGYTLVDIVGPKYAHSAATYLYDPAADTWSSTTSIGGRGMAGVVLADGRVVVAGGEQLIWNGSQQHAYSTVTRLFDPSSGSWTSRAPLRAARANFTLVQLQNGQLLAAGGDTPTGTAPSGAPNQTADVYDWLTNAWYGAANLQEARSGQGSADLGDGRILLAGGGTASSETYRLGDITPPVTATPVARLRSDTTLVDPARALPARITWSAQDAGGAGAGTYDIARSSDGGAYTTLATNWTATTYSTTLTSGHTYTFRVRTRDWAGNVGAWRAAATVKPANTQQTSSNVKYTGTWSTGSTSQYSGGTVKYASAAGASATYSFTGRAIAWVTTKATRSGSARVYVDGVLVSTLSLYASAYTYRYIAFEKSWTTSAAHTIRIEVVGTPGHPRIDIDAFLVLRNP